MVPTKSVAVPVGSKRSRARSWPGAPARSMVFEIPMPRSLPFAFDPARRSSNAAWSAISSARSRFFSNAPQS